jgi:serine/threonine protein kinase
MSEARVRGFLLTYYEKGTMPEVLPQLRLQGELKLQDQLCWSKQLTAALKHIHPSLALFYSDLKMDNVLLAHGLLPGESFVVYLRR